MANLKGGKLMDIIRAWKDEGYRNSLSEAECALPPYSQDTSH